jgi:hypothetical protein
MGLDGRVHGNRRYPNRRLYRVSEVGHTAYRRAAVWLRREPVERAAELFARSFYRASQ